MQLPDLLLSVVREKVLDAFQAMGAGDSTCSEMVMLDDGYVVGRKFCSGRLQAVWLLGETRIRIFNEVGDLLDTQSLDPAEAPVRKAA
ncbi:MAG TPA: hypothetical protein VG826_15015 [Pirellulales bacterium]|nr:hypothetical protein [Pirellulales bacterium]